MIRIIGLHGLAGAGKDELAMHLVRSHNWCRIGLADTMKRAAGEWFGFSDEQLWGASHFRNDVDQRWGVSPRHVLQQLGTEVGRTIHRDVWIRYALDTAARVLDFGMSYSCRHGLAVRDPSMPEIVGVVIPDVRFENEAEAIREAGGRVWLIDRPGSGLGGAAAQHASEAGIPSGLVDHVIWNGGTKEDLYRCADDALLGLLQ